MRNIKLQSLPSNLVQEVGKTGGSLGDPFSFTELLKNIDAHTIKDITLLKDTNNLIAVDNLNGIDVGTVNLHMVKNVPELSDFLLKKMYENNVNFDVFVTPPNFLSQIPFPIMVVFVYLLLTSVVNVLRSNSGNRLDIPGNPLTMLTPSPNIVENVTVSFDDVAGIDEAKFELEEVVEFLRDPERYQEMGAKMPGGILLEGEPGTGKTLLARAVAGEAGVNFLSVSGSEFIEMFVGVGASRVRKLFETAKQNKPCVIFIDEIDAIGRQRGAGVSGGNDEREQTLNQILTNMDGFENSDGIIVMAATNRADILDSALKRPGRFDRKVYVNLPDRIGREEIFKIHLQNKKLSDNVNITDIALLTGGFSGADLANLANEAAIMGVRENNMNISMTNILDAYEKITIGLPSATDTRDEPVRELVAYHETGHALLVLFFKEFFDLEKVTMRANKNGAGGYTLFKPKERFAMFPTKKFLLANMIVMMGGRAAEILLTRQKNVDDCHDCDNGGVFDDYKDLDITTGATGDLKQVYGLARRYVTEFGLAEELYHDTNGGNQPFLGRDMAMGGTKNSELTKKNIDDCVNNLVKFALDKALFILENNHNYFHKVANLIIENETVDTSMLEQL